ncbi:MAG: FkbM family methyltransferase [Cupriavidus sp.]|nr:MAG: FkbM family methyltransferase [Cupriavidus sp.]
MTPSAKIRRSLIATSLAVVEPLKARLPAKSLPARALGRLEKNLKLARFRSPRVVPEFAKVYPDAFFIQIGSNDGDQLDPLKDAIRTRNWRGIMVEPVPYVFEKLKLRHGGNPRLTLENIAISKQAGVMPFYHLRNAEEQGLEKPPRWYDALGSFSKDVVLKHEDLIPDLRERLTESNVNVTTFDELCSRNNVKQVDLIHIDTEGHDFEILKTIDLPRYRPKVVIYEHHHLNPVDRAAAQDYLRKAGYAVFEEILDTWCIDTSLRGFRSRHLRSLWTEPAAE